MITGIIAIVVLCLIFYFFKDPERDGYWTDKYGVRFTLNKETLIKAPANLEEYIIPDGVIYIYLSAFEDCADLKCITFPNSVKHIGKKLFKKCSSLSEIFIPVGSKERFAKMLSADLHDKLIELDASPALSENQAENSKLKRPDFNKEETFALGLYGLSFCMLNVNGRPEPEAEVIIISELEGFTLDDVKRLYQYAQDGFEKEQQRLGYVMEMGLGLDFVRQQYAAGFWAKVISARSDRDDPSLFESWHKTVKKIGLDIKGRQGVDCLDYYANLYDNEYEHGKGPKDDLFIIFAWLSNLQYLQYDQKPSERTSQEEMEKYTNKTTIKLDDNVSFNMIRVDGGTFTMGGFIDDEDAYAHERPRHEVSVSTFLIGENQVTQELWEAVMGNNPSNFKGTNKPVEEVSWNDCQAFIKKLNEKTGKKFRLPTEAEWEFAARGGRLSKNFTYSGSNDRNEVAWHPGNRGTETTHEVKTKLPNELGIFDMSGNVLEWVNDWFDNYPYEKQTDPLGPSYGRYKVLRGGSWYNPSSFCRVSFRNYMEPDSKNFMYGLRLAL